MISTTYTVPANVDTPQVPTYEQALHNAAAALSEAQQCAPSNPSGAQALVTVSGGWLAVALETASLRATHGAAR